MGVGGVWVHMCVEQWTTLFFGGVCGGGFLYSPGCPEASYMDQDDLTFQGLCHHPQLGSLFSLSMFTWVLEIKLKLLFTAEPFGQLALVFVFILKRFQPVVQASLELLIVLLSELP